MKSYDVQIDMNDNPVQIHAKCMTALEQIDERFSKYSLSFLSRLQRAHWPVFTINKTTVTSVHIGHMVADFLAQVDALRGADIFRLNRHFWTPHSLGPIKEMNYMDYGWDRKRELKLEERKHQERVVCERTPLIISTSKDISKTLVSHFNVHPDRIIYFPPCVNGEYRPRSRASCEMGYRYLAEKSGVPEERLRQSDVIIEASRADRTKRKDLILAAFEEIARKNHKSYLFVFGGPKNQVFDELAALIDESPVLAQRAFLVPETVPFNALVQIFSLAAVYVSASEMEGFGMSVLQAAASGVPVVSSGFIPFASLHLKEIARIVQSQVPADYAREIENVLSNPAAYAAIRKDLINSTRDFSWNVRVKDLHTSALEPTIIFAENRLDNFDVRLGEQEDTNLMVTTAHIHRGGLFIADRLNPLRVAKGSEE
jgi:glycosyltransferase involved in cell wall biosynthesis